jgi:hypothetical protein
MAEPFIATVEPIIIIVSRDEVLARDISSVVGALTSCLGSPERALSFFEKVDIAFHGYDTDTRELFEIDEVREFVALLDDNFPYWLFFLTKNGLGLQAVTLCLMPPNLTKSGRQTIFPERLNELFSNRWFPAMEKICLACGFSEHQINSLTDSAIDYFTDGPRRTAATTDKRP